MLETGLERLPDEIELLRLEVLADNDVGRRFYEAHGFESVERRTREIADESYPVAVYAREIEASGSLTRGDW